MKHFTCLRGSHLRNLKNQLVYINTCVDKSLMSKIYHLPQTNSESVSCCASGSSPQITFPIQIAQCTHLDFNSLCTALFSDTAGNVEYSPRLVSLPLSHKVFKKQRWVDRCIQAQREEQNSV